MWLPGSPAVIGNTLNFDPPQMAEADVTELRRTLRIGADSPVVVYTGTLDLYERLELASRSHISSEPSSAPILAALQLAPRSFLKQRTE